MGLFDRLFGRNRRDDGHQYQPSQYQQGSYQQGRR